MITLLASALFACKPTTADPAPPPTPAEPAAVAPPPPRIDLEITVINDPASGEPVPQVRAHSDLPARTQLDGTVNCGHIRRLAHIGYERRPVLEGGDFQFYFTARGRPGAPVPIEPLSEAGSSCHLRILTGDQTLVDVPLDVQLLTQGEPPRIQTFHSGPP